MKKAGTVKEIWRYPVKGMAGESIQTCHTGEFGLPGDRLWALRDMQRDEIQSCKFRPDLLRCTARWRNQSRTSAGDLIDIEFPDGTVLGSDHPDIHNRLSALTGHPSQLEALQPAADFARFRRYKADDHTWLEELKATFEREDGEPLPDFSELPQAMIDYVSVPGTFFLVAPLHIVTTATLSHLKKIDGHSDWDMRRFRPNIVIETNRDCEGLVEQEWIGKHLRIGDAVIECTGTTPRCGAITRAQRDFDTDKTILRTVVREAEQNVGIYGRTVARSDLRVGDSVWLE